MNPSNDCKQLVMAWEGLPDGDTSTANFDPYMDPIGVWTIGYGRALRGVDGKYLLGPARRAEAYAQYPGGITRAQAVAMLDADLAADAQQVTQLVGAVTAQSQFDALLSFEFNLGKLGASSLLRFHRQGMAAGPVLDDAGLRTLWTRARNGQLKAPSTIAEAFAAYSFAQKTFMGGLFYRRLAEWRVYAGDTVSSANAYGAHARTLFAHG